MKRQRRTYQQRIFIYFFAAFTVSIIFIMAFQFNREKQYRTDQLETKLDNITGFAHQFIHRNGLVELNDFSKLDSIKYLIPDSNIRLTVIDKKGDVQYDSFVKGYLDMENHLSRSEFQKALYSGSGGNIRHSATTGQDFYYYARYFDDYYIRCAVVYNIEVINFLKTERLFIFFMLAIFLIMGGLLFIVTRRLGKFVNKLRDFAIRAGRGEDIDPNMEFVDSEFGDIQLQIVRIYKNLRNLKDDLSVEKDRVLNHLNALNEGIAFFSHDKEKILANSNFIQHINLISEHSTISAELVFEIEEIKPLIKNLEFFIKSDAVINHRDLPTESIILNKNERYFKIQSIVFPDKSFEILISDVTRPEKRRLLKQQLTSNIAHELKTPLASVKGYLDTILTNSRLTKEKQIYFVDRAYTQSKRLEALLNDISLLNNIEDAGDLFEFKKVRIKSIVKDVIENLGSRLSSFNIRVELNIDDEVVVDGNESLLSSIFQNFVENTINYAGENSIVMIRQYLEDEKFYYFSYSDNGKGISDEHLPRIFERFYRTDEGRTRENGGTGLGLAIVKNAVQMHKGDISAKNKPDGGLEFLFSLAK